MGFCCSTTKKESLEKVPSSLWGIEVNQADGTPITMNHYQNQKALIIVNVREQSSGKEKGFEELNDLIDKYKYSFCLLS